MARSHVSQGQDVAVNQPIDLDWERIGRDLTRWAVGLVEEQGVDPGDVGVIERCQQLGLAPEAGHRSGSAAKPSGRILIATSRSRVVSTAFQTTPIPPSPIFSTMR